MQRNTAVKTHLSLTALLVLEAAQLAPIAGAEPPTSPPKMATSRDSSLPMWAQADARRFHDAVRQTHRVTYPDAGTAMRQSCDLTGDGEPDLAFFDSQSVTVLPYVPYGSDANEAEYSLRQQADALRLELPGVTALACTQNAVDHGGATLLAATASSAGPQLHRLRANASDSLQQDGPPAEIPGGGTPTALAGNRAGTVAALVRNGSAQASLTLFAAGKDPVEVPLPGGSELSADPATNRVVVGDPDHGAAYVVEPQGVTHTFTAAEGPATEFGRSVDISADHRLAVGAPGAFGDAGAVTIAQLSSGGEREAAPAATTSIRLAAGGGGEDLGTVVLRQVIKGRLGASVAWVPTAGPAPAPEAGGAAGGLLIGRPVHDEHPGALFISDRALHQNHNTGLGVDGIDRKDLTWLAAADGAATKEDQAGGTNVAAGAVARGLVPIIVASGKGTNDVWTVDLNAPTPPAPPRPAPSPAPSPAPTPPVAPPPPPDVEPGYQPVNETTRRSWLGPFSSGFGGVLARQTCEVTGDGKPDVVATSPLRHEWKYDPYYADSTPTHGWVANTTGELWVIPGGAPGGTVGDAPADQGPSAPPSAEAATMLAIHGPTTTDDPAVDASMGLGVACIGDVNRDGVDDIAIGSHTMTKLWILFGGARLQRVDFDHFSAEDGYVYDMPANGSATFDITQVGDVNADGVPDVGVVVANARYAEGKDGAQGKALFLTGAPGKLEVDLRGPAGFESHPEVLASVETPDGHTMNSFTPVGDVTGDGAQDYVATDFQSFTSEMVVPGVGWLYAGSQNLAAEPARLTTTYTMPTDASYRLGAGHAVAAAGDTNGDGVGDFLIGFDGSSLEHTTPGGVFLIAGTRDGQAGSTQLDPDHGAPDGRVKVLRSDDADPGFAYAVATAPAAGPNSPSGTQDLAIGHWGAGSSTGAAYLMRLADIRRPFQHLGEIPHTTLRGATKSRFGRSVAFSDGLLGGQCTALIGGDGVIDEEATATAPETKGYAHTAHIHAEALGPAPAQPDPGVGSSIGSLIDALNNALHWFIDQVTGWLRWLAGGSS